MPHTPQRRPLLSLVATVFLLLTPNTRAQTWTPPQPKTRAGIERPYFFAIEGHGKKAFILGTRHIGVPLSAFPDYVLEAIDRSQTQIHEVKFNSLNSFCADALRAVSTFRFTGPRLSQQLSPEAWKILAERMIKRGYPLAVMDRLNPTYAYINMSLNVSEAELGQLEREITARVNQRPGVRFRALESAVFQVRLLANLITVKDLEKVLMKPQPVGVEADPSENLNLYLSGSLESLERQLELVRETTPTVAEALLDNRNRSWIPQINRIMKRDPSPFFAVGAMHLVGPLGILQLLRQEGYTVARIDSEQTDNDFTPTLIR